MYDTNWDIVSKTDLFSLEKYEQKQHALPTMLYFENEEGKTFQIPIQEVHYISSERVKK